MHRAGSHVGMALCGTAFPAMKMVFDEHSSQRLG